MAARDDSVIRGSLIACMIFLLLSLVLNFLLWKWGDTSAGDSETLRTQLQNANSQVQTMESQATLMKAMLGVGTLSDAEFERMSETVGDDPDMAAIEDQFIRNMKYFGSAGEDELRNYDTLPGKLVTALLEKNAELVERENSVVRVKVDAKNQVDNALKLKAEADANLKAANDKLAAMTTQFDEDRARINLEKEQTRDQLTQSVNTLNDFRRKATEEKNLLVRKGEQLQGTIDNQKLQLNRLRSDNFETTQGEIRYVFRGGNVVTINLGAADALRPGVTFGVIDGDEIRLKDAKVKATIQITQLQGDHLAQARIVALPEIRNPIIPGDKIFSPFWAPGRKVKIALAGDIDIDGDNRPDNEAIKGMIKAAGAEVAAEVAANGAVKGKLDASIRFLVVGESPDLGDGTDLAQDELNAQSIAAIGNIKAQATELGLTVLPAWKLQNYLTIMNDQLTTPLGSAARGEDFSVERIPSSNAKMPSDLPELYKRQVEGMQQGNKVLSP